MAAIIDHGADALGGRLLTPTRVAVVLDVSPRTVARLAKAGRLERVDLGHRTVRYTAASVEGLIYGDDPAGNRVDAQEFRDADAIHPTP